MERSRMRADQSLDAPPTTTEAKVSLFLSLFGARRDVYARFWENPRTGKKGYSPACRNDRIAGVCQKPRVKCSECPNPAFSSLDAEAASNHLLGRHTIGS